MTLENLIILVCAIFIITYFLIYEINWQWEGFNKIKSWFKQKGGK